MIGVPFTLLITVPTYLAGQVFTPAQRLGERLMVKWVRILMWVQPWFHLKTNLGDVDHKGRPGVLLVSNHRSHLDVFVLLANIRGVRILARRSLLYVLPLAPMLLMTKQILVPRGNASAYLKAMEEIRVRLRRGETVHVFPEMTRCEPGARLTRNFSAAAFLAAIQEKATIVPIVFQGTDSVWPKGVLGINSSAKITVTQLEPITHDQFPSANELRNEVKRRIDQVIA